MIDVAAPPAAAFRIWTEEIGRWWPLATHSVGQAAAATCALEGAQGGRIYETTRAGDEHLWGRITLWEPPHRLAHTWHPGRAPDEATTVEVSFRPIFGDRTRLELVHGGWPAGAAARRADYDRGWEALLRDDYAAYVRTITAD
jgi:uncharacterized protein YndB with AHSA1/START domain